LNWEVGSKRKNRRGGKESEHNERAAGEKKKPSKNPEMLGGVKGKDLQKIIKDIRQEKHKTGKRNQPPRGGANIRRPSREKGEKWERPERRGEKPSKLINSEWGIGTGPLKRRREKKEKGDRASGGKKE